MKENTVLMRIRNPKEFSRRELERQKKVRRFCQNFNDDQYAFYDKIFFPFKATKTSDLYF